MNQELRAITSKVLGRQTSFLEKDLLGAQKEIQDKVSKARILVIGAAGSIGSAFVRALLSYRPKALHLLDISENSLVEVVRDLRSSDAYVPKDFATFALDFGREETLSLLKSQSYDYILNFSALKHVRSERDPFTLMRLLDVNVLANQRLIEWIQETQKLERVFCVSSDKAVRSANLMGASKAFMERVFLASADKLPFSSARFANVAFSDGSLLDSFRNRLAKQQPLSAPKDVRRFFISSEEAGQLCLLGCFVCENREIVYPLFEPESDMLTFSEIAEVFLKEKGYRPIHCQSEQEARNLASQLVAASREWPCYFTDSDTSGEKLFEEFVDPQEQVETERFPNVGVITNPVYHGHEMLLESINEIKALKESGVWTIEDLVDVVRQAIPEMNHVNSGKNLDQKM